MLDGNSVLFITVNSVIPFLVGSVGVWLYYRQKLVTVQTELEDKKVIIKELIEHSNRVQQTQESVSKVKPIKKEKVVKVEKPKKTKK